MSFKLCYFSVLYNSFLNVNKLKFYCFTRVRRFILSESCVKVMKNVFECAVEIRREVYSLAIISAIKLESNTSKAKQRLPKSLSEAPMW